MKRKLLLFCFSFIRLLYAEYSRERYSADSLVQDGVDVLYNYDFDNDITLFYSARDIDYSHPIIPFVLFAAKWLKTHTEGGYDASYNMIIQK